MTAEVSHDDIRSLAAKLDGLELTDEERAVLSLVFAKAQTVDASEVEGFVRKNPGGDDRQIVIDVIHAGYDRSWLEHLGIIVVGEVLNP